MDHSRTPGDPFPHIAVPNTTPAQNGHTLDETEVIRTALHELVVGLSPADLHALWDVLRVFLTPRPPLRVVLAWLCLPTLLG